jgi:hypothetical protein
MLQSVNAIRFDRLIGTGKTRPSLMACVCDDGSEVEVVAKFVAGCEARELALVREAIGAMLAADLDLPVPEPFVVVVEVDFVQAIPDATAKAQALKSPRLAFGSKKLPPGFATYPVEKPIPRSLLGLAAEIFAFDYLIANPDRTVANPNLLFNGREFGIYDHELAFITEGVLGWRPPWEPGAAHFPPGNPQSVHVFQEELRGRTLDLNRLAGAFEAIADKRIDEYRAALPQEWISDATSVNRIIDYIRALKEHLPLAINQLQGALA